MSFIPVSDDDDTERVIPSVSFAKLVSSLKIRTGRNVYLVGVSQGISLLLTVSTVAVLTRLLTPDAYGVYVVGTVFLTLFYYVQDFGVSQAIVQRDSHINECVSTGLAVRWIISIIIGLVVLVASPAIARFYGDGEISLVLVVLTLNLFVLAFAFVPQTMLTRSLDFSSIALATVVRSLLLALVSISLALVGLSYWSLVISSIAGSLAFVLILSVRYPHKYTIALDSGLARELLRYGKHIFTATLMSYVIFNVDQMIVGKVLGVAVLGIYFVATRIGRTLGEQLANVVTGVLFATMSRIKDDLARLKIGYTESLRMIAIASFPLCMGLSAVSPSFVKAILGSEWSSVAFPLSVLAFQGLLNSLITPVWSVFAAVGKPQYVSSQGVLQAAAVLVGVYPVAVPYGVDGVCIYVTTLSVCVLFYYLLLMTRFFHTDFRKVVRPLINPLASSIVMYATLFVLGSLLGSSAMTLVIQVAVGTFIYFTVLHIVSRGRDMRDLVSLLRRSANSGRRS